MGQVHVFAGRVKMIIVSQSSCRTPAILKYNCPLILAQVQVNGLNVLAQRKKIYLSKEQIMRKELSLAKLC